MDRIITSKESAIIVKNKYNQLTNNDLITDLKGLTSSYTGIEEYLTHFINYKIVHSQHPHDLIIESGNANT